MKSSTGHLAFMTALGGGFLPILGGGVPDGPHAFEGIAQYDGTFVTVMAHPDGRTIAIRTGRGNGWQRGPLIRATRGGAWGGAATGRDVHLWRGLRTWLADHEPGREEPYCGGGWLKQPRALDGRERDILCRILGDIERACRDRETQQLLLSVVCVDPEEIYRLLEVKTILNPRTD